MKLMVLCLLAASLGCATAQPLVISDLQRKTFEAVVRDAEAAGAADGSSVAAARLADAKSNFEYAQHIPMYPDRARLLIAKAQEDANASLELARAQAQARLDTSARHQVLVGSVTP